ncbi:MAG: LytTR family DNA-binding domain-containing protein [Oscillospiraceae bacterium]|nr:LytTR family DNA-binding domain-containing protein [Oscillospiraceae bacterium]
MIRVAVCDDEKNITESIRQYLIMKAGELHNETLEVTIYHSGVDFLRGINNGYMFHIVFMDIQMDRINGIEAGQILRSKPDGDDAIMIYISYHDCYYEELSQVGSFRFIKKPINADKLDDVFSRALRQAIKYKDAICAPSIFEYRVGSNIQCIRSNAITYIKQKLHKTEIYIFDDVAKSVVYNDMFYSKLCDIEQKVPRDQFVRCHISYIVNLDYVYKLEKDGFFLKDTKSTRIPISRTCKSAAKTAYFKYMAGKV